MTNIKNIELLSPAKNAEIGIAAINHGADAVYIGAPQFGARQAAANSLSDIESLVTYAHQFHARVYVALNTILQDDELEAARNLIFRLYEIGVDALIIQDMALLEMDLPPIELHASTQCDIRTPEKVQFLQDCGFSQVVLARETSIDMMRTISASTSVALEAFVHGALCVSYSGQCYMSQSARGRSANRGACAQMCRVPYDLIDSAGNELLYRKHLLSLKDFNASNSLQSMLEAGISSFKIEGRLKDANYVKNITAYYRKQLDILFESNTYNHSSLGRVNFSFEPNPQKTFYRGSTEYFLNGRAPNIWSFDTPKSLGEPVGKVRDMWRNAISINAPGVQFANGDGLCFLNSQGEFEGFRVNKVELNRLFPLRMPDIKIGAQLYRNQDTAFEKLLSTNSAQRKLTVNFAVSDTDNGFAIKAEIKTPSEANIKTPSVANIFAEILVESPHEESKNIERAIDTWRTQFGKLGDTIFELGEINLDAMAKIWFVPVSKIADWRRQLVDKLLSAVVDNHIRKEFVKPNVVVNYPDNSVNYRANISNQLSKQFYEKRGVEVSQMAYEQEPIDDAELMRTRHCIKYAVGLCHKYKNEIKISKWANINTAITEPLYLRYGEEKFRLTFDCSNCEMVISQDCKE
ncbi:MAG: U32 family peptidase [bacterium]